MRLNRRLTCVAIGWLFAAGGPVPRLHSAGIPASRELSLVSAPRLSPDAGMAVFEWCGDIWLGPGSGGEARRLVADPATDCQPWFSPDGKRVVFQSDRTGKPQIHSVPICGGDVKRHSFHGEGCELLGLSPDGNRALIRGRRERDGPRGWRLMEIDLFADHRERLLFDAWAESPHESADGRQWLFVRNGEQLYREGYQGSRAAQIWSFHRDSGSCLCQVAEATESLSPLWSGDGGFYYVSARTGSGNLWKRSRSGKDEQLTHYQGRGVVMPTISADGSTLMFRWNHQVMKLATTPGANPQPVRWFTRETLPAPQPAPAVVRQVDDATYHPQHGWFVSVGGKIWQKSKPSAAPVMISEAGVFDSSVRVSRDGKHLAWLRDDGLKCQIMLASLRDDGPGPAASLATMPGSATSLCWLPDCKSLGWISGRGDVWLCKLDGSPARCVFPGWERPVWDASPDGRWLVVAAVDASSNRDLWLVSTSGSPPPVNLTRSPGWESFPLWSPDGNSLLFRHRQNRAAPASLRWLPLRPELQSAAQEIPAGRAIADAAIALPIRHGPATQVRWSRDGKSIWYQCRSGTKRLTCQLDLATRKSREIIPSSGMPVETLDDGSMAWLSHGTPECIWPDGRREPWPFEAELERPAEELLTWRFRQVWRTLAERFYDTGMHGLDWDAVRSELEPIAARAADSRQFDRMINQLMGRLNASHLTFQRELWPGEQPDLPKEPATAHPGWIFEDSRIPGPLRVLRAIPGSPGATFPGCPEDGPVGWTIQKIAGIPVDNRYPLHRLFQDAEDRSLPVVIEDPAGNPHTIELRCISYRKARSLLQEADDNANAQVVAAQSPGVRYLRLQHLDRSSVDALELQLHRILPGAKGIILDLRGNDGGREADRLLSWFHQPRHSVTQPRGGPEGYPADRLPHPVWHGPLAVLCDEHTFSNAEIFCHAIQASHRSVLIGRSTAGGVISAVMVRLAGIGRVQIPYRGWFRASDRQNLDLHGARPETDIPRTPEDESHKRDPQLDAAIRISHSWQSPTPGNGGG